PATVLQDEPISFVPEELHDDTPQRGYGLDADLMRRAFAANLLEFDVHGKESLPDGFFECFFVFSRCDRMAARQRGDDEGFRDLLRALETGSQMSRLCGGEGGI